MEKIIKPAANGINTLNGYRVVAISLQAANTVFENNTTLTWGTTNNYQIDLTNLPSLDLNLKNICTATSFTLSNAFNGTGVVVYEKI